MEELTPLTKAQADALLKRQPEKAPQWPSPQGLRAIREAVEKKAKRVTFDGATYLITYGYRRVYPASKEEVESVRLNRADGTFVPMGYISMKKIMSA